MNENFNQALTRSGLSMYALAKRSGVPYTTINEIRNGKNDINQCVAATVCRLEAALDVSPGRLLNEFAILDGVEGKYGRIHYRWSHDDTSKLTFKYKSRSITLDTGKSYTIPTRMKHYQDIAEFMIKEYIEHEEWEKASDAAFARRVAMHAASERKGEE